VDGDGVQEVCVGTNYVHILQWNGTTYEEEHVINAGAVGVSGDESYKSWIFKYGLQ